MYIPVSEYNRLAQSQRTAVVQPQSVTARISETASTPGLLWAKNPMVESYKEAKKQEA
jgi:hypothetical protein